MDYDWATSTMRRVGWNRSIIRSVRNCYPCDVLPMSPEWIYRSWRPRRDSSHLARLMGSSALLDSSVLCVADWNRRTVESAVGWLFGSSLRDALGDSPPTGPGMTRCTRSSTLRRGSQMGRPSSGSVRTRLKSAIARRKKRD